MRRQDATFVPFARAVAPRLMRTAYLLSGDPGIAEDLVQETLARLYARWPRLRDDPEPYARTVLVNLNIDRLRRRHGEVTGRGDDVAVLAHTRPGARDASTSAAALDLTRALGRLTPRERTIVVLRHYVDLPEAEVAATLGVSVGTVKSTTSRALAKLRGLLTEEDRHVQA